MKRFEPHDGGNPFEVDGKDGLGSEGSGSYSHVLKARRQGTLNPSIVAIKVMRDRGPEAEELLVREHDCLLRLREERPDVPSAPVPKAFGMGRLVSDNGLDERPGLAMEYFDRDVWPSLRDLLGELSAGGAAINVAPGIWVARLGKSIAGAIEACHKRGVVHRDLSDTNVLVRRDKLDDPEVTIIDFGSAEQADRWERSATGEIQTRGLRGTTLFESPEMRDTSTMLEYRKKPATDLFSIGSLLVYSRLSMEYGCKAAADTMERNGGFAYQLVPLLSRLGSKTKGRKYPITVADMETGAISRTLTKYHPADRYFRGMNVTRRMELLLEGRVEDAAQLLQRERPRLEDELDDIAVAKLVRLATPMTFHSIVMRAADIEGGGDVQTVARPQDAHAWLHEDGTLVIGATGAELRDEQMRQEYTHGPVVEEWNHIDVRFEATSHPWTASGRSATIERVTAPVMVDDDGTVKRLSPRTMHGWFKGMSGARQFDLAGIDTSSVTDMTDLFRGCSSLTELRLPTTWVYGRVRTMERMFSGCRELREMSFLARPSDVVRQLDTSRVSNFRKLFEGCAHLGEGAREGLTCLLDTSAAQYLDSMFSGCSSLRGLDLDRFKTDRVTGFSSMFESCSSLGWLRQSFSMRSARWTESMFRNCAEIEEVILPTEEEGSDGPQPQRAHPSSMFAGCSNLRKVGLGGLLAHPLTATWHLFSDCSKLREVSVIGMDTEGAQDMGGTFAGCESLERVEGISELRTGNATTFGMMFSGCRSLKELDLGHWDTGSLRTFSHMFKDCASLTRLDISGWDTSSVTAISYAFDGANEDMEVDVGDGLEFPQIRDESQYVRFAPPAFARKFSTIR